MNWDISHPLFYQTSHSSQNQWHHVLSLNKIFLSTFFFINTSIHNYHTLHSSQNIRTPQQQLRNLQYAQSTGKTCIGTISNLIFIPVDLLYPDSTKIVIHYPKKKMLQNTVYSLQCCAGHWLGHDSQVTGHHSHNCSHSPRPAIVLIWWVM